MLIQFATHNITPEQNFTTESIPLEQTFSLIGQGIVSLLTNQCDGKILISFRDSPTSPPQRFFIMPRRDATTNKVTAFEVEKE